MINDAFKYYTRVYNILKLASVNGEVEMLEIKEIEDYTSEYDFHLPCSP